MIMRYQMAVLLFAGTSAALAAPPVASVWQVYQAELARQCPAKHLEWLAPADIRDALDDYKSRLSTGLQSAMTTAERHRCRDVSAGVTCDNVGDLDIAWKNDLMPAVAASFCRRFTMCRKQSDCDNLAAP
ncbi:hypothetical protein NB724_002935 [Pantoea ananatis]|uniref:hypothetical protein n=1 Tax=Pantoea ananas TaxID=553 RepID=UPI001F40EF5A|nr:hypothetical protein [Pantoea ananatis]MCW0317784.1 hypothetical protein [Pantoea ananatis]MCW0335953.1 hypothetical protein [Pantoea ananatis]MCW0349863.1 hypothetical protein [Pantoea ananatis]MCW0383918.1 hypothetical protein [Pantoea ananatis]MCW0408561.1 hypothetical protein [Pantoea ananatis]